MYNNENAIKLNVVGILRPKEEVKMSLLSAGFYYSNDLADFILEDAAKSEIVLKQQTVDYNVLTGAF